MKNYTKPFIVFSLLIIILSTGLDIITWSWTFARLVGCILALAILALLLAHKSVNEIFSHLPKPHKTFTVVLFFFLFFGHHTNINRLTFPFVSWRMFGASEPNKDTLQFTLWGTTNQNERVYLNYRQYFSPAAFNCIDNYVEYLSHKYYSKKKKPPVINVDDTHNKHWIKNVSEHIRLRYSREYPGIDLKLTAKEIEVLLHDHLQSIAQIIKFKNPDLKLKSLEVQKGILNVAPDGKPSVSDTQTLIRIALPNENY